MKERLLKPQDAAQYLGIELGTLHNWVRAKRIEVVRISEHTYRIRLSVLEEWVRSRTVLASRAQTVS